MTEMTVLIWTVVSRVLRFLLVHLAINMVNYTVTTVHYRMCCGLHSNTLVSFMYSYVYGSSEYCIAMSTLMVHTSHISRSMWHTMGASLCLETMGWMCLVRSDAETGRAQRPLQTPTSPTTTTTATPVAAMHAQ